MARAELVALDRQAGRGNAERREDALLVVGRFPARDRLLHPAEDDARAVALELDRDDAGDRLELDDDLLQRQPEHERGAEHGMPRERQLERRREDADPHVGVGRRRRQHEDGLGEVHLARERLHVLARQVARVREDGELVAGQRRVGEDVGDDVAEAAHDAHPR